MAGNGECACTDEPVHDRKRRANARDEVSFAYESHIECFYSYKAVCTLKTEYRIKESIKPCEIWKAEAKEETGNISWR